ncbi:MAG: FAD-dependent oxidoreductase [Balneolaceae bacterium]|nr:FAD-dependent oxidoreductase [Balneolaceae bacterium]
MSHSPEHVVVIGAGIAGLSAAWFLSRKGMEVTVVDRDDGTDNCSYGNAGMIVPSHVIPLASPGMIAKGLRWMLDKESPFYIRPRLSTKLLSWAWKFRQASSEQHVEASGPVLRDLLLESREIYMAWEQGEEIEFTFGKGGLYMYCRTEEGLEEERRSMERCRELGIPAEELSAEEVGEREPGIHLDIKGAVWFPWDGHVWPRQVLDQLKVRLMERGVTFRWRTEVTGARTEGDRIRTLRTADGEELDAGAFALCAGAWSGSLGENLGAKLPMLAGKGYSMTLHHPPVRLQNIAILSEEKVTCTPLDGGMRFGGTMELTGTDISVTASRLRGLKKSVCRYLPDFSMEDLEGHDIWVGLRPCSPDGLPYVGQAGSFKNLFVSTGHAMMGMSLGPSCGLLLSELMTRGSSELMHPKIDPNRFT